MTRTTHQGIRHALAIGHALAKVGVHKRVQLATTRREEPSP
jgi:hypothetical protein